MSTTRSTEDRTGRTAGTHEGHGRLGRILSGAAVALGCVLFLGGFAWGALLYQPYAVPTGSMAPTIGAGERVLAQRIDGADVRRGDVVVFNEAEWGDLPMVKRVVGVGGDEVACCTGGRLTVNGEPVDEPYLPSGTPASVAGIPRTTVPEGRLFLLGDERAGSLDSTAHLQEAGQGSVSRDAVVARVDAVAWPMEGMLDRPAGFAALPGGISEPGPLKAVVAAVAGGVVLILGGAAWGPVAGRFGHAARARRTGQARGV
ncbi:signal peptidase I [Streptomyces diastaticus]|uniref:Signal peptidase I n=1 Tax=Streptomyces rutgersensis TaxID=53451 RepID=A0ABX6RS35_9ACTN|nr:MULTISPECIES: signal peptidase I [Streptomyces]NEE38365.1 signal peptidase I [Streptomyces sp. SID7982]NEE53193.1 signal peptidase I [Streptomyces sp. SID8455]PJM81007.1 signal peptidase I [Streptomyces sp. TSRI0384-2]QNE83447.1 signal peptidase I [Streptomyces rutgersensis]RPK84673.1 Signal peptidase I T [Streptomyces sp. ADI98-12]